jgi:hypothetical protein
VAKDSDILADGKEAYRIGIDAERDNRDAYIEDYRFARLDEHWPEDVLKQRQLDGKPSLTIPRLPPFIRQIVNDSRQNRPRIRVKPVDSFADPKTALVLDGLILNIEQASNAAVAYDTAIDCAVSGGFGYFRIDVEYANDAAFNKELRINRIANPLSVVGDPYSQAADSSDWNNAFVTTLIPKDVFERKYKSAAQSSWFDTDYRGLDQGWMQGDEIMVAEWWQREEVEKTLVKLSDGRTMFEDVYLKQAEDLMMYGIMPTGELRKTKGYKVKQHLMTGAEVLETTDWAGCFIPIIPVYGEELNIEGKRIYRSLIASAKDAQRRLNYWVSAATEIVALAPKTPFIGDERAFTLEPEKWATVNTRTHSHIAIPNGSQVPQRQPLDGGQAVGAISQALAAGDDIKTILGMYDASLGARSNETSGKAITARQKEGDTSTFHFIDNLSRAIQHAGRVLVDLIPAVYTPGMMVRILGQDGKAAVAKVENRAPGAPPPQAAPLEEGLPEGVQLAYDFETGRYDVTVDSGPSFNTQREESSMMMIELLRAVPSAAPFIGDKLAKAMNIPEAEEISERLKAIIPQQAQGGLPPQVQQMIEQGKQMIGQLQKENEQLKTAKDIDQQKMQNEAYKAETDRVKELLPFLPPEIAMQLAAHVAQQAFNTPDIAMGQQVPMPAPPPPMPPQMPPQPPQGMM